MHNNTQITEIKAWGFMKVLHNSYYVNSHGRTGVNAGMKKKRRGYGGSTGYGPDLRTCMIMSIRATKYLRYILVMRSVIMNRRKSKKSVITEIKYSDSVDNWKKRIVAGSKFVIIADYNELRKEIADIRDDGYFPYEVKIHTQDER